MDFYKHICKHLVVPLWAFWERSPYLKHLKYLEQSQYFSAEKIKEIQWGKIKKLLNHAYDNCTYYKFSFENNKIHPNDIKTYDDFSLIPILTKEAVHNNLAAMLAPNIDKYNHFLTSGSTGTPIRGHINKASSEFKRACGRRSEFWSGYDLGERIYCLYGNPEKELTGLKKIRTQFRRKYLTRTEVLDLLTLTEQSMDNYAKKLQKNPPSLIWGHAHGLYLFARYLEKKGLKNIRPKGMYSAGMVLHTWERKKVEEVFQCKLQDRYGCEELGLIATECKAQEGLHINTDVHYVEFLGGDGKPVASGESGQIVITDLTNFAMPFIRYKIEDLGIPSKKICSCGRTQPLIEKIEGRIADFLITPDKKLISGISLTDHFAGHIPGVAQIQIIQETINLLTLNIVKDTTFNNKSLDKIKTLVEDFFGDEMKYQFNFMQKIPMGPSGKYRFTICRIDNEIR